MRIWLRVTLNKLEQTQRKNFIGPASVGFILFYRKPVLGILERPALFPSIEEVSYKLLFVGKSGIGKTLTVTKLAGLTPVSSYIETSGIRITDIYWPVKIWDKIILFKLQCWEAGTNSYKKYSHIPLSCTDRSDVMVFLFSFNDASSFSDLPFLINKSMKGDANRPAIIVIGTRFSNPTKTEVSISDVKDFESKYNLHILTVSSSTSGENDTNTVAPILNIICEQLWVRDQQYILNQGITV